MSSVLIRTIHNTFYTINKKLVPHKMLSYILSTWDFLRTLKKCEKHAFAYGSCFSSTSLMFLKNPLCLYNSTMHLVHFSLFPLVLVRAHFAPHIFKPTCTGGLDCGLSPLLESIATLLRLDELNRLFLEPPPIVLMLLLPKLWLLLRLAFMLIDAAPTPGFLKSKLL